jgi:hypothetical protein
MWFSDQKRTDPTQNHTNSKKTPHLPKKKTHLTFLFTEALWQDLFGGCLVFRFRDQEAGAKGPECGELLPPGGRDLSRGVRSKPHSPFELPEIRMSKLSRQVAQPSRPSPAPYT